MSFAAVLYIDGRTSSSIEEIWRQQADENISRFVIDEGHLPHITLDACEELSLSACKDSLELFAEGIEPFSVEMPYIGLFPHKEGAVFLGVTMTERLLTLQKSFHEVFGRHGRTMYDVFTPGKWVPHCTLAHHESPEKDVRALELGMTLNFPITATCDRLAVIEFPPWNERLMMPLGNRTD